MNGYIASKPITLNGVQYAAGDTIPAEAVLPSRVRPLLRSKTIVQINNGTETAAETPTAAAESREASEGITLPIQTQDGILGLVALPGDVVKAVEVLQLKQDAAIAAVAEIDSENALIIIDACTKTAALKKAVKTRAEELQETGEAKAGADPEDEAEGTEETQAEGEDGTADEGGDE